IDLGELFQRCGRDIRDLLTTPAAPNEDRSKRAFRVIMKLIGRGFTDAEIRALIEAHPRGIGERYVVDGKDPGPGIRRARAKATKSQVDPSGMILDGRGRVKANLANALTIIRRSPEWRDVLAFNEFRLVVEVTAPPPWITTGEEWKN